MRTLRHQAGQIFFIVAFSIVTLMGFAALALDLGFLYATKRQMQTAADAAAIAAANALQTSNSADYVQAAKDVASLDGFTDGTNGVTVTVPASSGCPNAANQQCVAVTIAQAVPTFFLGAIGYSTVNVSVQASGGTVNGPACIYALDPSAADAISLTGNVNINVSCGIIDDSTSASALYANGIVNVTTTSTGVAGNYSSTGIVTFTPKPITQIAPAVDPLGSLQPPSVGTCTQAAVTNAGTNTTYSGGIWGTVNLAPAVYSGGWNISNPIISRLNFAAGTYGNGINIGGDISSLNFSAGQYQNGGGSGNSITIGGNISIAVFAAPGAGQSYTFCGPLSISGNFAITLQPGLYYGGITVPAANASITFSPGTYILAGGGLSVTGNSTLTGTGVTFYNTTGLGGYGPINLTGNETANLSAPTSGSMEGILFFQDRTIAKGSSGSTILGNSNSTFNGALYFPTTSLNYIGNSSASGYTLLIADTLSITGNSNLGDNYSSLSNGSPIRSSALYE